MTNSFSRFNPFAGTKKKIVAEPLTRNPAVFFMEWTRGRIPKDRGAENYWLSSQQLPVYSLSGPLKLNARRINIAMPAREQSQRQFASVSIGGAGILNGQLFSQPLFNAEQGGFTRQQETIVPKPFETSFVGFDTIAPAGVA